MKKPSGSQVLAVAAVLALLVSVTGVSYAVGLVNGATIVKRSIPANAIKKNVLTNKEIKESSLPFAAKKVERVHVIGGAGQIPFGSGWAFTGSEGTEEVAGYWKDQGGTVHLRGAIGRLSGSENLMFTLPVGYRPKLEQWFITYGAGSTVAYVYVDPNGDVKLQDGTPGYVGLGNITFRADQ